MPERRVPCVGAILYNGQGQILLQLRDDRPDLAFPNYWTTLGGAIEAGESPEAAMRRELLEEIEIAPEMRLWRVFDRVVTLGGTQVTAEQHVFVGEIVLAAADIKVNEGQGVAFFGRNDLENIQIGFGFESLFRDFFETVL
jgi:8-oxo-dGTP diphosphatase